MTPTPQMDGRGAPLRWHKWRGDDLRDGFRGWATLYRGDRELASFRTQITNGWTETGILAVEFGEQETTVGVTIAAPGVYIHGSASLGVRWSFSPPVFGYGSREFGLHGKPWDFSLRIFAPGHGSTSEPRFPALARRLGNRRRRRLRPYPIGDHKPALAGWEFRFAPLDWTLGRRTMLQNQEGASSPAHVQMPEGLYPCTVTMTRRVDGRPRWPFGWRTSNAGEVKMLVPIPEPGKGENSYDLDDDAMFSLYGGFEDEAAALDAARDAVLKTRQRRAGRNWKPDAGWPEGIA